MEIVILIVSALGLVPVYFLIRAKLRKRYKFDIDYKNITFALFSDPKNPKLDNRLCIIFYFFRIVNNSEESKTLKNVFLSYSFDGKVYQNESYVVHSGIISDVNKPAVLTSNGIDSVFLLDWYNIRTKLGENETIPPGGVFSGSAVFLFESIVSDVHQVKDLKLIITDFHGKKLSYPMAVKDEWFNSFNKGFSVINKSFTTKKDNTIKWD